MNWRSRVTAWVSPWLSNVTRSSCAVFGRVLQALPLSLHGSTDHAGCQVEKATQEVVGMLCLDAVWREGVSGEMLEIRGNDDIRPANDGSSKHVAILGVGQDQAFDQAFIADEAGRGRLLAEIDDPAQ